jgi:hypothetical protein
LLIYGFDEKSQGLVQGYPAGCLGLEWNPWVLETQAQRDDTVVRDMRIRSIINVVQVEQWRSRLWTLKSWIRVYWSILNS